MHGALKTLGCEGKREVEQHLEKDMKMEHLGFF